VCCHIATRGQHTVSHRRTNGLRTAGLQSTRSNVEARQLVVHENRVKSLRQLRAYCSTSDNGRTDVDDERRSGRPSMSTADDNVCRANARIKQHKCIKHITQQLDVSLATVHNTVCSLCVKDLTHDHKARRVGLSRHASHMLRRSRSFCSASMQETKHALVTRYPKPEKHP
jgi:hypothetical protein